ASVLLPLPPFCVASTIVCIESSFERCLGFLRHAKCIAHRAAGAVLARDVPVRSPDKNKGSRWSDSATQTAQIDHHTQPGVADIPRDYGVKTDSISAQI